MAAAVPGRQPAGSESRDLRRRSEKGGNMYPSHLKELHALGQSVWLDHISRDLVASCALRRLITEDGIRGTTSNPAIFEAAILHNRDYETDIKALALDGQNTNAIYESLSLRDVQGAADEFRPLHLSEDGADGFVSLEVNPHLAYDCAGTIVEARRLWERLARPNVLIKVPATDAGLPAIRQLICEGININCTLIFGLERYRQVVDAYLGGLEDRAGHGKPIRVTSVASFFVGRIDAHLDQLLDVRISIPGHAAGIARQIRGEVAIASAKLAYLCQQDLFGSKRFTNLAIQGARTQRLLWASVSSKSPGQSDVKYLDALIGPSTITTAPPATLDAYRDHGAPESRLVNDLPKAIWVLAQLPALGIDLAQVARQLEDDGVQRFVAAFDRLLAVLSQRIQHHTSVGL